MSGVEGNHPRVIIRGWGNYPGANCLGAICLGCNYPGGNYSRGNCPGSNRPRTLLKSSRESQRFKKLQELSANYSMYMSNRVICYRNSCLEVFCKITVLKHFAKVTEKHSCQSFLLSKDMSL